MREFIARVKALLRRVRMIREEIDKLSAPVKEVLQYDNLKIDTNRREVLLDISPLRILNGY